MSRSENRRIKTGLEGIDKPEERNYTAKRIVWEGLPSSIRRYGVTIHSAVEWSAVQYSTVGRDGFEDES